MSETIFTKIIKREIPAVFIYEDDICAVILDKFPTVPGQSLVISKQEIDYAFDLDDDTYLHLFKVAKQVAKASDKAMGAARTCLAIEGFEVPHVHIKIYPMPSTDKGLGNFLHGGEAADDVELSAIAEKIKRELAL